MRGLEEALLASGALPSNRLATLPTMPPAPEEDEEDEGGDAEAGLSLRFCASRRPSRPATACSTSSVGADPSPPRASPSAASSSSHAVWPSSDPRSTSSAQV